MSNIATLQPQAITRSSLQPANLDEAMHLATLLSKSSIVPKDFQGNPGNVFVAMQWGNEIGLAPLQAMQSIAVINGRPSVWGDAVVALVRASGLLESMDEGADEAAGYCVVKRRGEPPVRRDYTLDDAKRAGLAGKQGPWQTSPKRMLQLRARAFALRDVFPDVLRGMHVAELAQDMPIMRDMGQADEVKPETPAPATKTEAIVEKLAKKKAPRPMVLGDVLNAIGQAEDFAALEAVAELAAKLESADDKQSARVAFTMRRKELTPAVRTYAQFCDAILKAPDEEAALAELNNALRALPPDQVDEIHAHYKACWQE